MSLSISDIPRLACPKNKVIIKRTTYTANSKNKMTTTTMHLVVDARERDIINALSIPMSESPGGLEVRSLDIGDAWLVAKTATATASEENEGGATENILMILERKTLKDLCGSIRDGRYRDQKMRMKSFACETGAVLMYALEGYKGFGNGMFEIGNSHSVRPSALQTCLLSMSVMDNIRVVGTSDVADTTELLHGLWLRRDRLFPTATTQVKKTGGGDMGHIVAHSKRNKNITPALCFQMQLAQIPGVSERIAGTIAGVWSGPNLFYGQLGGMSSDEERRKVLERVPAVGKKLADKIVSFMFPQHSQH